MKNVTFKEIRDRFETVWSDGNELLFFEIAWNALMEAGVTRYETARQHAEILLYPYVLSMLNGEFSERMFHESYSYEFPQYDPTEEDDENGLTGAALGWLYCEATKEYSNHDDLFYSDAREILESLTHTYRHKVADPLFKVIDNGYLLLLLWYYTAVTPVDSAENEIRFKNAKEYYDYCSAEAGKMSERDASTLFDSSDDEDSVMYWLYCHSCEADD